MIMGAVMALWPVCRDKKRPGSGIYQTLTLINTARVHTHDVVECIQFQLVLNYLNGWMCSEKSR